jgi:hypothetical protein
MTHGVDVEVTLKLYGVECEDSVAEKAFRGGGFSEDEILYLVREGMMGNVMELRVIESEISSI